jgi:hypothetical protein
VTARAAGDRNSPAFHRFQLDAATALPDGSSLANGRVLSSVPFVVENGAVLSGKEQAGPVLLFAKLDPATGWVGLTGRVSVTITGQRVTIAGDYWEQAWKEMESTGGRFALTIAVESLNTTLAEETGGAGSVRGMLETQGDRIAFVTGTYTSVSAGGNVGTTSGTIENDEPDMAADLAAYWEHVKQDRVTIDWTDRATAPTLDLGQALADAQIPLDSSTYRTETLKAALITRRTCTWTPLGAVVSYQSGALPVSIGSIAGVA